MITTKRAWRSVSATRPTLRGSRIAQYSRTSNTQNPRRCVYHSLDGFHTHFVPYKIRAKPMPEMYARHPMSIYRCVVQDYTFELARFEASRTSAHDKRFLIVQRHSSFLSTKRTLPIALSEQDLRRTTCKINVFSTSASEKTNKITSGHHLLTPGFIPTSQSHPLPTNKQNPE